MRPITLHFIFISLAVVARAPRKALGSSSSVSCYSVSSNSKVISKKGKASVGQNPLKMWPTPVWQKELKTFFDVNSPTSGENPKEAGQSSLSCTDSFEQAEDEPQGSSGKSTPEPSPQESYNSSEED